MKAVVARFFPTVLLLLLWGFSASAYGDVWIVGSGGQSWEDPAETMAGVSINAQQYLGPASFTLEENVTQSITWNVGIPPDATVEGNGHVWNNSALGLSGSDVLVDGDSTSTTGDSFKAVGVNQKGRIFFLDLGASFPASQIIFYPSPEGNDDYVVGYEVSLNDGRIYDANGSPVYEVIRQVDINPDPVADIRFPTQLVRFVKLRVLSPSPFEIAEIEVHGEGFVPRGLYETALVQLDQQVNFGKLTFRAKESLLGEDTEDREDGGREATVSVRMRNGTDDTPLDYYQIVDIETKSEGQVTKEEYEDLPLVLKGGTRPDLAHWTPWTDPLIADSTGVYSIDLDLPGPRDFFQVSMRFEGNTSVAMQVDSLALTYTPPLAALAVGEIALRDEPFPAGGMASVPAGVDTVFTYDIKADMSDSPVGFDGVRIVTLTEPQFLKLEIGDPREEVEPDSVRIEADGLRVYFPSQRITAGDTQHLRVTFRTQALLFTTQFTGQLLDSQGNLPQQIAEGDATREVGTDSQEVIFASGSLDVLQTFDVVPAIISPNGDGRNDAAVFSFVLIHLVQPTSTRLQVYDLSGRLVRQLHAEALTAGQYAEWRWDGTNSSGKLVPPGSYLARISVGAATGEENRMRVVGVVY